MQGSSAIAMRRTSSAAPSEDEPSVAPDAAVSPATPKKAATDAENDADDEECDDDDMQVSHMPTQPSPSTPAGLPPVQEPSPRAAAATPSQVSIVTEPFNGSKPRALAICVNQLTNRSSEQFLMDA